MTEEKVDLPLQTESEKNYELIALFWQITGSSCVSSTVMGGYCINPKLKVVMAGYWWLRLITGWLWVIPVFSNNAGFPPRPSQWFFNNERVDRNIKNEINNTCNTCYKTAKKETIPKHTFH